MNGLQHAPVSCKRVRCFETVCILIFGTVDSFSQAFVNLDFESANLTAVPAGQFGGYVSSTNAIPSWTAFIDGIQTTQVLQNNGTLGAPSSSIWGPNSPSVGIFQGQSSVILTAGVGGHTTSLSQTGLVPVSAASLLFEAAPNYSGAGTFLVSLGGQNLNYFALSTGANYTLYGADISAFGGQTETMTFSDTSIGSNFSYEELDAIQFSTSPIPEPSALGLSALGGLFLACRRWRKSPQ